MSKSPRESHDNFQSGCMYGMLSYTNVTGHIYKIRQLENVMRYEVDFAKDYCEKSFENQFSGD
jgi:hypothetical protein